MSNSNYIRLRGRIIFYGSISFLVLLILFPFIKWDINQKSEINDGDPYRSVPYTDLTESLSLDLENFWKSHKPSYKCPSGLLFRVGGNNASTGDGGKWVCGLHILGTQTVLKSYDCTVYSFGVNDDSSFEAQVLEMTKCNIFAFDPTVNQIAKPINPLNPRIQFQKIGLGNSTGPRVKTLKTLMDERGHKFIDILKVDVEGAEYTSLEKMMKDFNELPFGQLLIELHTVDSSVNKERVLTLVRNLERLGLRVFSIEYNTVAPPDCCSEFSFINLNHLNLFYP